MIRIARKERSVSLTLHRNLRDDVDKQQNFEGDLFGKILKGREITLARSAIGGSGGVVRCLNVFDRSRGPLGLDSRYSNHATSHHSPQSKNYPAWHDGPQTLSRHRGGI